MRRKIGSLENSVQSQALIVRLTLHGPRQETRNGKTAQRGAGVRPLVTAFPYTLPTVRLGGAFGGSSALSSAREVKSVGVKSINAHILIGPAPRSETP
jgi:hypothetical protein